MDDEMSRWMWSGSIPVSSEPRRVANVRGFQEIAHDVLILADERTNPCRLSTNEGDWVDINGRIYQMWPFPPNIIASVAHGTCALLHVPTSFDSRGVSLQISHQDGHRKGYSITQQGDWR